MADWLKANKLKVNTNKTLYILFPHNRSIKVAQTVTVSANVIEKVKSTILGGLVLDDILEWETHEIHCKNMISSGIYALSMAKKFSNILKLYITHYYVST